MYANNGTHSEEPICSEEGQVICNEEEVLEKFREAVKGLKDVSISTDDDSLLRYLRVKSFNLEKAVELVCRFEKLKRKNHEIFNTSFNKCKMSLECGHLIILKQRDMHGRRVVVFRNKFWDPEEITLENIFSLLYYAVEEMIKSPETQINGLIMIIDNSDVPFTRMTGILSYFTYGRLSRLAPFLQGASGIKAKGTHVIPINFFVSTMYQACKYLLKKKIRDRVHIHSGAFSALHKYMGKENLPDFLDGDIPFENCADKELINALYSKYS